MVTQKYIQMRKKKQKGEKKKKKTNVIEMGIHTTSARMQPPRVVVDVVVIDF